MPLVIMIAAMVFNMVNGELLGSWFADWNRYPLSWLISPYFIIGIGLFLTGMAINMSADYKLISLRGKGETGYKLPVNGLFNYVSSPNLLGEIIEWGGFALLTWSLPALAFFIWTCANLLPRAISNHRWYHSQFPGYPAERRILVPFIW
jgi:protein-S-isoprenylcysteine O-methyltransferase Ste14